MPRSLSEISSATMSATSEFDSPAIASSAISNFGSWLAQSQPYGYSFAGLRDCYEAAIPFYRGTLVSDVLCTGAFFALHAVLSRAFFPAERVALARPIQVIDGRDLARWMIALLENDTGGTFNACSPAGRWTMGDLIDALVDASPSPPEPAWTDETALDSHAVKPWTGLPLWVPSNDSDHAGFMSFDCTKAARAGLTAQPLPRTIDDTAAWLIARDNAGAWKNVISAEMECAILAASVDIR